MSPSITRADLPRQSIPSGTYTLEELPEYVHKYSGDLDSLDVRGDVPRSVHMAFAIAIGNVDQAMAFEDSKRDTLDALIQAWRAVTPEGQTVEIEQNRAATSVEVTEE